MGYFNLSDMVVDYLVVKDDYQGNLVVHLVINKVVVVEVVVFELEEVQDDIRDVIVLDRHQVTIFYDIYRSNVKELEEKNLYWEDVNHCNLYL